MIYSPEQYRKIYYKDKPVSTKTIIRRCEQGLINSAHTVHHIGRYWLIEVPTPYVIKLQ